MPPKRLNIALPAVDGMPHFVISPVAECDIRPILACTDRMDLAQHLPDDYGPQATGERPPESP